MAKQFCINCASNAAIGFVQQILPTCFRRAKYLFSLVKTMWYYCAVTGESKKIVFTSGATEKITSGGATSDFWSPHK
jgi:hypothetical protein